MPRNGGSVRKRAADDSEDAAMQENDDEEMKDDPNEDEQHPSENGEGEDDDDVEEEDEEMEEGLEQMLSPSPDKKGQVLRSGRVKRRRSEGTSGLTPPGGAKRARRTMTDQKSSRKSASAASESGDEGPLKRTRKATGGSKRGSISTASVTKSGRESLLVGDHSAVATAQDPESSKEEGGTLRDNILNKRLSYGKPSAMLSAAEESTARNEKSEPFGATDDGSAIATDYASNQKETQDKLPPLPPVEASETAGLEASTLTTQMHSRTKTMDAPAPPSPLPPNESTQLQNGDHEYEVEEKEQQHAQRRLTPLVWRIGFMLLFAFPIFVMLWPACVRMAEWMVPLKEMPLPPNLTAAIQKDHTGVAKDPPKFLLESLDSLVGLKNEILQVKNRVKESRSMVGVSVKDLKLLIEENKSILKQVQTLNAAETKLRNVLLEESDLDAAAWQEARSLANELNRTILNTPAVGLWEIESLQNCEETIVSNDDQEVEAVDSDPPIEFADLKERVQLLNAATQTSQLKILESSDVLEMVQDWIESHIETAVEQNVDVARKIELLSKELDDTKDTADLQLEGLSLLEIKEIVADRLEMELADRTGEYDHASLHNGASIIKDGLRATSKSSIDTLPLGNRLLHLLGLRFHGYGPEAAITPTYPVGALGQCWSFKEIPIEEQMKRRRSQGAVDGYKSGSLGSLTVSLPTPIAIRSVVIEHPSKRQTDQVSSAIRAFRIFGYQDAYADSEPWLLGSFEFDGDSFQSLQEFSIDSEIRGKMVPAMHSVTLAIDSNWGHEYTCLYRFRVHGDYDTEAEDDDDR